MGVSGNLTEKDSIGVDAVFRLLSDADAFQARLKELNEAEARAQAVIDLVGPAESIPAMMQKATEDRAAALDKVRNAEIRAQEIIDQATASAASIIAEANARYASAQLYEQETTRAVKILETNTRTAVEDQRREIASTRDEVAKLRSDIEAERSAFAKEQSALLAEKQELAERRRLIDRRLERMSNVWSGVADE